ncbi:MAG TPA: SDR family oxidoreductase [Tepidisphaeraceae bacterium]|nr:SDR family oxidoreductase [Tepidisphaeraceae bacterium]
MSDSLPLDGRCALVTGASRGLGAEIARQLAAAGAKLVLAARDERGLQQTAAEIGGKARWLGVDLGETESVEKFLDRLEGELIDIVVNNAATQGPIGEFATNDFAAWRAVFQTNFFSPARICQRLIPAMRAAGHGKIINLSGGGATSPRPHVSAYGASKCALARFSETLAEELKGSGIDVNCVAPGAMNTRMLDEVLAAGPGGAVREYERARKQKDEGGVAPAKAAELVVFLASPESDGISGRLISAVWDNWRTLAAHRAELMGSDIYTLRRVTPEDRGKKW